jgi:hypothetical protein
MSIINYIWNFNETCVSLKYKKHLYTVLNNTTVPPDKKNEQYLVDTKTINNNESPYKSFQALHLQT